MKTLNIIAALATAVLVTACSSESEDSAGVGKSEPAFVLNEETVFEDLRRTQTIVPYKQIWPTGENCTLEEFWELAQSPESQSLHFRERNKNVDEYMESRGCHESFDRYGSAYATESRRQYMAKQK